MLGLDLGSQLRSCVGDWFEFHTLSLHFIALAKLIINHLYNQFMNNQFDKFVH